MKPSFMKLPRAVLVGKKALNRAGDLLEELKLEGRALIVADETTLKIAGQRIHDTLKKDYAPGIVLVSESTMAEVKRLEEAIQREEYDFVLAVGGGRVIDTSKLAAKNTQIEYLSIPTAAAHDGIASGRASIKARKGSVSIEAEVPAGILADTEVLKKAPYRLMAAGCGDLVSKYTSVKDWELARDVKNEEYSEYAAALSMMSARLVMDSPESIEEGSADSSKKVVKALISCGVAMSIAGSSRPASGSEHKFSHALDMISQTPALHGEQCGVGSIMMMKLHGGDWEKIRDSLSTIRAPTTARDLGVADSDVVEALVRARKIRPERYTILDEIRLDKKETENLARKTGVIG